MKELFRYFKPYIGTALLSILFLFLQAFAELTLPSLMAGIVDKGILIGDRAQILFLGYRMLLVALAGVCASIIVNFCSSRVAAGFTRDIRRSVFVAVQSFSNSEIDRFSTASLLTRTTSDITQVQQLIIMGLRMLFFAPIMGFGSIVMAIKTGSSMSWILIMAIAIVVFLILIVFSLAMPKFRIVQKLVDRLNLVSREHLSGLMVIRAFRNEEFEGSRFDRANQDLTRTNLFVNRIMATMMPVMSLVMNGVGIVIVWVGSHKIAALSLEVGNMMAYLQYAMHVIMSFLMLSVMFIMIPRAAVSADRISEVLSTKSSVKDAKEPQKMIERQKGLVEFISVSFKYEEAERDVLSDISFSARPGTTTAIIGPTGCGKSTVVNLIPRFYDVSSGSIRVGGVDIRSLSQADLRNSIGFVFQKGVLRSGTIAENLRIGKENASFEDLVVASQVAQASEFIDRLKDGYESTVSEGGNNFSGGQKQRLSIARALVKKPDIYIFDDSFSALDAKTDASLRLALSPITKKSTLIIVSQRIHTIMNADQILVLDNGKIVGSGTHEQLLKSCVLYRELAQSQLAMEVI